MQKLDLSATLSNLGVELVGIDSNGDAKVRDENGEVKTLDINSTLTNLGVKNAQKMQFAESNTSDEPLEYSPVTAGDRALLDIRGEGKVFGQAGEKDSINFLRKKFEDTKLNKNGDLVVKTKGLWHKVDPSFLGDGDPWEMTKEFGKDLAEMSQEAIDSASTIVSGVAGSLLGPQGAAVGIAAGPALGKAIRTTIGKAAGIDSATPGEQVIENSFETLMTLGTGKVIQAGSKHVAAPIYQGLQKLAAGASERGKSLMANFMAWTSGMAPEHAAKILKDPASTAKYYHMGEKIKDEAIKLADGEGLVSSHIDDAVDKMTFPSFKTAIQNTKDYITHAYGRGLNEIENLPKANTFKLDTAPLVNALQSLEPISKLTKQELSSEFGITPFVMGKVKTMVDEAALMANLSAKGNIDVKQALNFQKKLNGFFGDYILPNIDDPNFVELNKAFRPLLDTYKDSLQTSLKPIGGDVILNRINQMWSNTEALRHFAGKASDKVKGEQAVQNAYNSFLKGDKKGVDLVINQVKEFGPKSSQDALNYISDVWVGRDLASHLPDPQRVQGSIKGMAALLLSGKRVTQGVSLGRSVVNTATHIPEQAAKTLNTNISELKNFVYRLKPSQREQLLKDDQLIEQLFGTILQSPIRENQMTEQLLNEGLNK
jgi:hypothetical protein